MSIFRKKSFSAFYLLTLFVLVSSSADVTFAQSWPEFSKSPWNGRYLHSSGKFELILNQFADVSLDVDIFPIPRSDRIHESHFFANIHGKVATLFHEKEPECRVDLEKVPAGVFILDHCGGAGDGDGLYHRVQE